MDAKLQREKQITKTSIIGIIVNLCLVTFKALVGLLAGSIAIILDAVNNLTDALSSVITIAGLKLSKRKPDNKHPFGYGRIEYFSAIIISGIVLAAGITSLVESVKKIIDPVIPDYDAFTIVIVVVAIITKLLLGRYVKAQGHKYNSEALVASGADASFDAIISAATLLCAVVTLIFHFSIDGIVGAVISAFIIKAGIGMLLESVSSVMGTRYDSEVTMAIKATVRSIPGVMGAYDLVLHDYGPDYAIGSIHVEVPADTSAEDIHKLTQVIQETVYREHHVFLTVGVYAIDTKKEEIIAMRRAVQEIATAHPGVLGTHGTFVNDTAMTISFDAVIDFTIADKRALANAINGEIEAKYPAFKSRVSFDTNYSD